MEGHLEFLWETQQYFSLIAVRMNMFSHNNFGVFIDRRPISAKIYESVEVAIQNYFTCVL